MKFTKYWPFRRGQRGIRAAAGRLLPLALCLLLAACSAPAASVGVDGDFSAPQTQPDNAPTGYRLLLSLPGLDGMAAPGLSRSVQDYCDELNIEVTVHDSAGDAAAQYSEIETFVTAGGQAILCWPVEPGGISVYLESARQRGIATLAFGGKLPAADATLVCDGWGANLAEAAAPFVEENMRYSGSALLLEDTSPTALPGFAAGAAAKLAELDSELEVVRASAANPKDIAALFEETLDIRLVLCGSFGLTQMVYKVLAAPAEGDDSGSDAAAGNNVPAADLSNYFISGPAAPGAGGALDAAAEMDFAQAGRDWVDMAVAAIEGSAPADKTVKAALVQPAVEDDSTA